VARWGKGDILSQDRRRGYGKPRLSFWFSRRSTSWGRSDRTATSDDSARPSRCEGNATRRNEPLLPSHESWRCCCIGYGGLQRSTSRSARPEHGKTPPRRP